MRRSERFKLALPGSDDYFDVQELNDNFDKLDNAAGVRIVDIDGRLPAARYEGDLIYNKHPESNALHVARRTTTSGVSWQSIGMKDSGWKRILAKDVSNSGTGWSLSSVNLSYYRKVGRIKQIVLGVRRSGSAEITTGDRGQVNSNIFEILNPELSTVLTHSTHTEPLRNVNYRYAVANVIPGTKDRKYGAFTFSYIMARANGNQTPVRQNDEYVFTGLYI